MRGDVAPRGMDTGGMEWRMSVRNDLSYRECYILQK